MNSAGLLCLLFGSLNLWRPDFFSPERWKDDLVFVMRCAGAVMILLGLFFLVLGR